MQTLDVLDLEDLTLQIEEEIICDLFECDETISPKVYGYYTIDGLWFCSEDCYNDYVYESVVEMDCGV